MTCRPWPSPVLAESGGRRWRSCSNGDGLAVVAVKGHRRRWTSCHLIKSTKPPVRQALGPADCVRSRTASLSSCATFRRPGPAEPLREHVGPGAGQRLSPPSTGVGPSPPMGFARARCGFHPHPTLVALTASGRLSERIDCAQRWSRHRRAPHPDRRRARQGLGARVLAHVREDSRLFSSSMEEGASPYRGTRRAGERL